MRASFVFSEVITGLRRNITMTIAMILTTAISLSLLGGGLLIVRTIDKLQDTYLDKLEVSVNLTADVSANDKTCNADPCSGIRRELLANPEVNSVVFENRDEAFARFKQIFASQPELVKLARPQALPASLHVKLKDPTRSKVIVQEFGNSPGVKNVDDQNVFLQRFTDVLNGFRNVTFTIALVQALAALLLISNTIQVSAYTRRTEVGIMRLVGATRWYTQLPFLLEAVVAGLVGAVIASGLLVAAKSAFLDKVLGGTMTSGILPPIGLLDVLQVSLLLFPIAAVISAVTGYVTLRLYVRI